jgi:hypothetical protein
LCADEPFSTPVKTTGGQLSKVDECLVDSKKDIIAQLVLHEGYLLENRDLTIPVRKISRILELQITTLDFD